MSEERGRQASKTKNPTRLRRGFSRMTRGFGLPKVNRATGGDGKAVNKRKDRVKNIKKKKKQKEVERVPAPKVTKRLEDILRTNNFVLWLGEEVNSVFTLHAELINTILKELCEKHVSDESDAKKEILLLLSETKPEEKDSTTLEAKTRLTAELGHARFDLLFSQALENEASISEADSTLIQITLTLVKTVDPRVIVYSGVDRNLEESLKHDNTQVSSMTPIDLVAFRDTVDTETSTLTTALLENNEKSKLILKFEGDIRKPHTLLFTDKQKRSIFGITEEGEELSEEAVVSTAVLTELAEQMPIVFLGRSLDETDPVCDFMKNMRKGKEEEQLGENHVALVVNASTNDIVRPAGEDIGVDFLTYTPHDTNTHITEFLGNMATAKAEGANPFEVDGDVGRFAAASSGLPNFLRALSGKETGASYINIFVNSLGALPFVLEKSAEENIVKGENEELEHNKQLFEAISDRVVGLTSKIIPPPAEPTAPVEGVEKENEKEKEKAKEETEVPDLEEKKETQEKEVEDIENETFKTIVRVLIPNKAVNDFTTTATEEIITKVETCFGAIADSKGRLDIRFVDLARDGGEDFEMLYTKNASGVGDIDLYHTVSDSDISVHLFEHNTNYAEEKALLFERIWTCAMSQEETLSSVSATLAAAQTELSATAVKGKRNRLFGKNKRPLEADPTKSQREGFIKRTVKSLARSSKKIGRKGSKNATAAGTEAVKAESNWVKGKKKADEEAAAAGTKQTSTLKEIKKDGKEVDAAVPVKATEEKAEDKVVEKKEEKATPKLASKEEAAEEKKQKSKKKPKETKADKKAKKKQAKKNKKAKKEVEPAAAVTASEEKAEKKEEEKKEETVEKKEEVVEKKEEEKKEVKAESKKEEKKEEKASPELATAEESKPKSKKKIKETKAEKKAKKRESKKKAKKDKKAKKEAEKEKSKEVAKAEVADKKEDKTETDKPKATEKTEEVKEVAKEKKKIDEKKE